MNVIIQLIWGLFRSEINPIACKIKLIKFISFIMSQQKSVELTNLKLNKSYTKNLHVPLYKVVLGLFFELLHQIDIVSTQQKTKQSRQLLKSSRQEHNLLFRIRMIFRRLMRRQGLIKPEQKRTVPLAKSKGHFFNMNSL